MSQSVDQIAKTIIEAGLSSAEAIDAVLRELPADRQPVDSETFAVMLVERELLTEFQATEVLAGNAAQLVLGDYVLLERVGVGGMGEVFKARHRHMNRLVAVKLLPDRLTKDKQAIKRFQREVRAAAALSHPNIVQAFDASVQRGIWYLVTEYVDGRDLAWVIARHGPLSLARAVDYIRQAARGLAFAHENGIVHRDIKPGNLLLDRRHTIKILDMGLARFDRLSVAKTDDRLTLTGQVMGTADYMAPEQSFNSRDADARADIYSLGCTFWRLFTGEYVYAGSTLAERVWGHQFGDTPSLAARRPDAPPALQPILERMLAKNPHDRYSSMLEVDAALGALELTVGDSSSGATVKSDSRRLKLSKGEGATPAVGAAERTPPDGHLNEPTISTGVPPRAPSPASGPATGPRDSAANRPRAPIGVANRSRLRTAALVACACAALAAAIFGVAAWMSNRHGALRVVIGDERVEVTIPGTAIRVTKADRERSFELDAGELQLRVECERSRLTVDGVKLQRGGVVTLFVDVVADELQVRNGERLIAYKELDLPLIAIAPFEPNAELIPPAETESLVLESDTPAEEVKPIEEREFTLPYQQKLAMMLIPAGKFIREQDGKFPVSITRPFYLGKYEVTQGQWISIMGHNPAYFQDGLDHPVESLTWSEITPFLEKLNTSNLVEGMKFVLPTEAQWEYACRAGKSTDYHFGDDLKLFSQYGWCRGNSDGKTHQVGQLKPNAFGLYDMHGNVWEWCADWYDRLYYARAPIEDPRGPIGWQGGAFRVNRGGGWDDVPFFCRAGYRNTGYPDISPWNTLGFRLALVPAEDETEANVAKAGPVVP